MSEKSPTGRFLTPDSIVPYPSDPQSFNRYSYVRNNPLSLTDPNGQFFFVPIIIGAIVGAVVGGTVAAVTGGDVFKGALFGAAFGAVGGLGGALVGANATVTMLYEVGAIYSKTAAAAGAFIGGAAGGVAGGAISPSVAQTENPVIQLNFQMHSPEAVNRSAQWQNEWIDPNYGTPETQYGLRRLPDYVTGSFNVGVSWVGITSESFQVSASRYGGVYWASANPSLGKTWLTPVSLNLSGGWLIQGNIPSQETLEAFLTGRSTNVSGGFGFGGGVTSNIDKTALEVGVYTPQVGVTYSDFEKFGRWGLRW